MSDDDVLEHSSQGESSLLDVAELLEIANSKVFDDQDGLTERKKNFEKVTSFFDLIKSSNNEDANLAEQDQSPGSSAEETLDEEIVGLKISSKVKSSFLGRNSYLSPNISAGIQYGHLKLHLSVTDILKSLNGLWNLSNVCIFIHLFL